MTEFLSQLTKDLHGKWVERLFGPAFLFWAGGLLLRIGPQNLPAKWEELAALPLVTQTALLIGAVLVLAASDRLAEALGFRILRFLEGYWGWPRPLAAWRARWRQKGIQKARQRWSALMEKQMEGKLTWRERSELSRLEARRHYTPRDEEDLTPTRLGDILRTAETRPRQRYGLDPVLLWPHLWLLLPEDIRDNLSVARQQMDRMAQAWFWGLLFSLWAIGAWPSVKVFLLVLALALVWMLVAYFLLLQAACTFADLLMATFDTQRWRLYEALRWPLPTESGPTEIATGEALTRFIQRGFADPPVKYHSAGE
ncbi:MAG: hypothetical protein D6794_01080 [Deltaproteobacteria bacterium]|nr:MAG: hypothetical protein D6794_01080 [Deltaproteobacteria bacterium]